MHNDHYLLINAKNEEEATNRISNILDNFGNSNNYYRIEEIYNTKEAVEDKEVKTRVTEFLSDLTSMTNSDRADNIEDEIKEKLEEAELGDTFSYYIISKLYMKLYEVKEIIRSGISYKLELLNSSTPSFFAERYDEYGITNHIYNEKADDLIFIARIDMHS